MEEDRGHRRHRHSIEWIPSELHPERKIAQPTVVTLRKLLDATRPDAPVVPSVADGSLTVDLSQAPTLAVVGGVARIQADGVEPVAVARVGRNSFVGYRLDHAELREVEVAFDDDHARIRIDPPSGPA
jgi:hypothetical protein